MIRRHLEQNLGAIHCLGRPREVAGELLRLGKGAESGAAHRRLNFVLVHRKDLAFPVGDRQGRCASAQPQPLAFARGSTDDDPRECLGARRILREHRPGHARHIAAFGGIDDHLRKDGLPAGARGNDDAGRPAGGIPQELGSVAPVEERHPGLDERLIQRALNLHGGGEGGKVLAGHRRCAGRRALDNNLTQQYPAGLRATLHVELKVARLGGDRPGKDERQISRTSPAHRSRS